LETRIMAATSATVRNCTCERWISEGSDGIRSPLSWSHRTVPLLLGGLGSAMCLLSLAV
jgi:hypothetical protein